MQIMKLVKDWEDHKAGDILRVGKVPTAGRVNPDFAQYAGMYWHCKEDGSLSFFPENALEDHILEEVFLGIDEVLKQEVVHVDKGVQDLEDFLYCFGLYDSDFDWHRHEEFDSRAELRFFRRWYCTDTWVGSGLLYIDGSLVAIFSQTGRKSDCNYKWLSKDAKILAKSFANEFMKDGELELSDVLQPQENLINFFG